MAELVLAFEKVSMRFARWFAAPKMALVDLSIHVEPGEVVCLLGPNGAGKSTLMRMACGLVAPTEGRVTVLGEEPGRRGWVRRQIGAVLESERWMIWQLSGRENLDYFASLRGLTGAVERRRRVDECLALTGLGEATERPVGEYSRGMKQRLALAGALLTDPALLLLDEPTLGLDLEGQTRLKGLMTDLVARGKAILLATHQFDLAARFAHRIVFLREGRLVKGMTVAALQQRYAPAEFEIVVRGASPGIVDGCEAEPLDDDTWLIRCPPAMAADPYPLLALLGGRGLELVRAGRTAPDLEAIYQRILQEDEACSGGPSPRPSCGVAG